MTLIAYVFPKLRTPTDVVRKMSTKSRFKGLLDREMVDEPKHFFNLNDSPFTIFIDH